jgi:hypothetical protein
MPTVKQRVSQIWILLNAYQTSAAATLLRKTINEGERREVEAAAPVLRQLTKRFVGKRRSELTGLLKGALNPSPGGTKPTALREARRASRVTSVRCPACRQVMPSTHRPDHLEKLCPARFAVCPSCKRSVRVESIQEHRILGCPTTCHACNAIVRQPHLQMHLTQDCPVLTRLCSHCHRRVPSAQWTAHQKVHDDYWGSQPSGSNVRASSGGLPSLGKRR